MAPYHQQRLFETADEALQAIVVLDHDGLVTYDPYYLDPWYADAVFNKLRQEAPWRQESLKIYGRTIPVPRLTAWYGDPDATYTYSGIRNQPIPWSSALGELRTSLQKSHKITFNSVLLNLWINSSISRGGCVA